MDRLPYAQRHGPTACRSAQTTQTGFSTNSSTPSTKRNCVRATSVYVAQSMSPSPPTTLPRARRSSSRIHPTTASRALFNTRKTCPTTAPSSAHRSSNVSSLRSHSARCVPSPPVASSVQDASTLPSSTPTTRPQCSTRSTARNISVIIRQARTSPSAASDQPTAQLGSQHASPPIRHHSSLVSPWPSRALVQAILGRSISRTSQRKPRQLDPLGRRLKPHLSSHHITSQVTPHRRLQVPCTPLPHLAPLLPPAQCTPHVSRPPPLSPRARQCPSLVSTPRRSLLRSGGATSHNRIRDAPSASQPAPAPPPPTTAGS